MFKHTAVQVHRNIVRKDPQIISAVPLVFGADTHPSTLASANLLKVVSFTTDPERVSLSDISCEFVILIICKVINYRRGYWRHSKYLNHLMRARFNHYTDEIFTSPGEKQHSRCITGQQESILGP